MHIDHLSHPHCPPHLIYEFCGSEAEVNLRCVLIFVLEIHDVSLRLSLDFDQVSVRKVGWVDSKKCGIFFFIFIKYALTENL